MHELGYCDGVLEAVERRADGRRVARVGVRIGALHRIVPDVFAQSFGHVADGGVAEDAVVELVTVPARATCRQCDVVFDAVEPMPDCPSCGDVVNEVSGGDEVVLEWVEYHPGGSALPASPEGGDADVPRHPG
ncbi:MAG: hydrogenase maturation nickel metallochaperone HypA/HybF [Actinomycetes bacterium]